MMLYDRDVNGVKIGTVMSKDQVIAIFGEPDEYKICDNGQEGIGEFFFFNGNRIHLSNGKFDDFYLCTPQYVAFINHIDGGLKVGDSLSRLDDFKYGKPKNTTLLKAT